jgi:uncharacterized protein (DUF1800 family)
MAMLLVMPGATVRAQETVSNRDEVVHVLNRITFGPRPGDVEAVQKMGLRNYIEQQLHPETIDDSAVEQQLAGFDLLQMSGPQLTELYQQERKNAAKKQKKLAAALAANSAGQTVPPAMNPAAGDNAGPVEPPPMTPPTPPVMPSTLQGKLAALVERTNQYRSVAAIGQLEQAKLVRAINSERQLQEVLVDFWSNHFNIDMKKGPDRVLKVVDDRDVIRPHIWGTFRELLEASAKSPAMLFYLDNASNTDGHPADRGPDDAERQWRARSGGAHRG